jgi:hypothetical protein
MKLSVIAALVSLCFFLVLFFLSLATPAIYYDVVYGGIAVSSALSIFGWRRERHRDDKASPAGIWIVGFVLLLFLVMCLLLPALG